MRKVEKQNTGLKTLVALASLVAVSWATVGPVSANEQIDRTNLESLRVAAYKALLKGDTAIALKVLVTAVRLDPNDGGIRHYLAYALLSAEDPAAALVQYRAYQKIQRAGLSDRLDFGSRLAASSNKEPARIFFSAMIRECSLDPSSLELIAEKCQSAGLQEQAEMAVAIGLKSTPDDPDFRRLYGELKTKPQSEPTQVASLPHLT